MNNLSRQCAPLLSIFIFSVCLLIVPWKFEVNLNEIRAEQPAGYHLLFVPPSIPVSENNSYLGVSRNVWTARVDVTRYIIQVFVVGVIAAAIYGTRMNCKPVAS